MLSTYFPNCIASCFVLIGDACPDTKQNQPSCGEQNKESRHMDLHMPLPDIGSGTRAQHETNALSRYILPQNKIKRNTGKKKHLRQQAKNNLKS